MRLFLVYLLWCTRASAHKGNACASVSNECLTGFHTAATLPSLSITTVLLWILLSFSAFTAPYAFTSDLYRVCSRTAQQSGVGSLWSYASLVIHSGSRASGFGPEMERDGERGQNINTQTDTQTYIPRREKKHETEKENKTKRYSRRQRQNIVRTPPLASTRGLR